MSPTRTSCRTRSGTRATAAARRDHRRQPGPHRRRRTATARRWSTCRAGAAGPTPSWRRASTAGASACSPRASRRATGSASGRRTAPSGCSSSTRPPGSARSWSTSTRPTGPTSWRTCCNQAGRARCWSRARSFKTSATTARWSARCAPTCPALREVVCIGDPTGTTLLGRGAPTGATGSHAARGDAAVRRPDQHPVHVGHHRLPQGRHAVATTTSSTTATSSASWSRYTEHDRVCIPVPFYHCFGMVMGNLGATTHGACMVDPGAGLRPGGDPARPSQAERCTSLYGVPTMFIAELDHPRFAHFDLSLAAHRDHGRLAVPGGGDEAGRRRDAHGRGDHLLRHDRDLAGVDPDPPRRRPRPPQRRRSAASTRTSRSRSSTRRPALTVPARRAGRAVHPRLQRDARLLGRAGRGPPRPIDAGALDAHRRPGDDGRRRLRATSSAGSRT